MKQAKKTTKRMEQNWRPIDAALATLSQQITKQEKHLPHTIAQAQQLQMDITDRLGKNKGMPALLRQTHPRLDTLTYALQLIIAQNKRLLAKLSKLERRYKRQPPGLWSPVSRFRRIMNWLRYYFVEWW